MKKLPEITEIICTKAVHSILLVMGLLLGYWAFRYTHGYPMDLSEGQILIEPDSIGKNLLVTLAVLAVTWLLQWAILRGDPEKQKRRVRRIAIGVTLLMGILLAIWVSVCHIMPVWDQMQVYLDAMDFKAGNFQDMTGYIYMCPHQYGLTFLYEIFLVFGGGYRLLQYLNVLMVMCIVFCAYLIVEELFGDVQASLYTVLGNLLFFPLWIYVNYVYGELLSMGFSMLGIWLLVHWCRTGKHRYALLSLLALSVAVLARSNALVVLIAVCITMLIHSLRQRSWKALLVALLVLLVPVGSIGAMRFSYELRSGNRIEGGIPASMYIAMGMQRSPGGAGVYNGYNNSVFRGEAGSDEEKANEIAVTYIRERIAEFRNDPAMAREFYKEKIQEQWNEPTFCSLVMTATFEQPPAGIVEKLYYGDWQQRYRDYMNRYVTVMYLGVILYSIAGLLRKTNILQCLMAIGVIGGFLFSILWEAKSRYVLPYIVLLIPYMALGISALQGWAGGAAAFGRKRVNEKKRGKQS
ncbi:MAG: glycosyltransferase family 39 protein [Lachnospiraceae bacterium]|nr:glycosyltransferase family 39 protein [Lachnospiraceae bacterium]